MKRLVLLFALLASTVAFSQKGKAKTKASPTPKNIILTKVDNISAEVITEKSGKRVVLFVKNDKQVDTLEVKKLDKADFKPVNFTIKSYTTQGKKFYYVNWKEEVKVDTKLKKENGVVTEDQLWDTANKTLLLGNTQKSSQVKETIFLDANKTASHDVEKKRNEGFEFALNADGSFILKSKTQSSTYAYNATADRYEIKSSPKAAAPSKKRR
ncbi:hypothetical protein ACFSX9_10570 [Flavobacterium ardleyense]|uniref:DUF4968 domain-containing protein n=1 Tax=Flavobacterium ardleyense TaxID=2038737 RepID=A0ABW5Z8H7_9FLAO